MNSWELRIPSAELQRQYFAAGLWSDATFPPLTMTGLIDHSTARCQIRSKVRPYDGTVGDVGLLGRRLAGALQTRGIGAGDVVAFQLPNWAETAACFYGLLLLGAVLVPVVHIYGPKELGHILRQSGARALITASTFGHHDYLADLDPLLGDLPDLELIIVVGAESERSELDRETVLLSRFVADVDALDAPATVSPDDPAIVGYTSGTTSAPKGVIHTHRTLLGEIAQYAAFQRADPSPTALGSLSGAPLSHITGLLGVLSPLHQGAPLLLIDSWDPKMVLDAMANDQVSSGGGATFFLISLLDHPDFHPEVHLPHLQRVGMGGSPIPAEVARRAQALGISMVRNYGSTEHPSLSGSLHCDSADKKFFTDGRPLPSVEVRLVDDEGRDVEDGEPGEILSRGPDLFAGYTDPSLTDAAIDTDGWYATGDVAIRDEEGYLTITDRKKDIIIRGGENVSAAEVEELLQTLPGIAEVAVVAAPDPRYGERACAMVRLRPDVEPFGLSVVREHLDRVGLARQKWPEDLKFVAEFPRTPSGKIQKHLLRQQLRRET